MIEPLLFESILSNWLWSVAKDLLQRVRQDRWPDFELKAPDGTRLLLEAKSQSPSESALRHLAQKLRSSADPAARFVLVTPEAPRPADLNRFSRAFGADRSRARWLAVEELPSALGKPSPGDWESPATWARLQTSALVKGLDEYKEAPIGPSPEASGQSEGVLEALSRQSPYKTVARLKSSGGALDVELGLGSRRENVTVVLSDLVNFSSLVTASRPDDLREAMGEYYRRARQAVFDHDGMLDKFIGDAVLAVFGYPEVTPASPVNALRFAQVLIQIGREVTEAWQAELNAVIATGTRVGVASGDIWPINIGESGVEVTLLGDTINLTARLEKNCAVDHFLIDNRTHTACRRHDTAFVESLGLQQLVIPAADAKGQAFPIRAWTQQ
jgi:class 3 adenylate cyclase